MKTNARAMDARENKMRSPKQGATTKPARGKRAVKLVIAIGMAPTLGKGEGSNKLAQRIKK